MAPHTLHLPAIGARRAGLVLLHSNGTCAEFYRPLAELLAARGADVTLVTLPGFDGIPPPQPTWRGLVDAAARVVAAVEPPRVLVGHSLGGLLALLIAGSGAVELAGLALMEPAVVPWRWLGRLAARRYLSHTADPAFRNDGPWFRRLHDPATFPAAAMAIADRATRGTDRGFLAALGRDLDALYPLPFAGVVCPVLAVRGASSGSVMALGQADLVRRLGARPAVLPLAGHWMANEQDECLAGILAELLPSQVS